MTAPTLTAEETTGWFAVFAARLARADGRQHMMHEHNVAECAMWADAAVQACRERCAPTDDATCRMCEDTGTVTRGRAARLVPTPCPEGCAPGASEPGEETPLERATGAIKGEVSTLEWMARETDAQRVRVEAGLAANRLRMALREAGCEDWNGHREASPPAEASTSELAAIAETLDATPDEVTDYALELVGVPSHLADEEPSGAPTGPGWSLEKTGLPWGHAIRVRRTNGLWEFILSAAGDDAEQARGAVLTNDQMREMLEALGWGGPCLQGSADAAFDAAARAITEAVSWLLALGADSTQANKSAIEKLAAHAVREYAVERAGEIGKWAAHDDAALTRAVEGVRAHAEAAHADAKSIDDACEDLPAQPGAVGRLRAEVERLTRERDAAASAHRERVEEVEMLTGGEGELWAWCPRCSKPCGPFRERRDGALCACKAVVVFAVNWRERAETAESERDALAEALDWVAPLPWSVVALDFGDVEIADADGDDLFVIEASAFDGSPADYANDLVRRLDGLERLTAPEASPATGGADTDEAEVWRKWASVAVAAPAELDADEGQS